MICNRYIERKGKRLLISPAEKRRKRDCLEKHPEFIVGNPDDLVHIDREASQLSWTRDPFDRIITAQSAIDRSTLITKDKIIQKHYEYAVW